MSLTQITVLCVGKKIAMNNILLSRLLFTEGKYGNKLKKIRKFRDVLSSGSRETGSTAKKVTAPD